MKAPLFATTIVLTLCAIGCDEAADTQAPAASAAAATTPATATDPGTKVAEQADQAAPAKAVADPAAKFDEWDVEKLASALEKKEATPVDANSEETRKGGVVPGAVLLTSSSRYEMAELPKEKDSHLVFYCGSTQCTASDTAADRAIENG